MLGDAPEFSMCNVVSHSELCWLWTLGSGQD
jgi:hypothetical protein